jgi:hypothetical protein
VNQASVGEGGQLQPSVGDPVQGGLALRSGFVGEPFDGVLAQQVVRPVPGLADRVHPARGEQ